MNSYKHREKCQHVRMIKGCVEDCRQVIRSVKERLLITTCMSVGVMGEPKLCRSLTKDKLGKPSKVQ